MTEPLEKESQLCWWRSGERAFSCGLKRIFVLFSSSSFPTHSSFPINSTSRKEKGYTRVLHSTTFIKLIDSTQVTVIQSRVLQRLIQLQPRTRLESGKLRSLPLLTHKVSTVERSRKDRQYHASTRGNAFYCKRQQSVDSSAHSHARCLLIYHGMSWKAHTFLLLCSFFTPDIFSYLNRSFPITV